MKAARHAVATACTCALLALLAVLATLGQLDDSPVKAERLILLSAKPTHSFRALRTPLGLDYIIARIRDRDRRLVSGMCSVDWRWKSIGAYADATASMTAEPVFGRAPGSPESAHVRCEWAKSGAKLAYRTTLIEGNTNEATVYRAMAAAYDGATWRTLQVYRNGAAPSATVARTPAAFVRYYQWDPRHFGHEWFGHVHTFESQVERLKLIASMQVAGEEDLYGSRCYRLDVKYHDGGAWYLWLDADHDLLIRRSETVDGDSVTIVVVSDLCASGGVWMARYAEQRQYVRAFEDQYARIATTSLRVTRFRPNIRVKPEVFTLAVPGNVAAGGPGQVLTTDQCRKQPR